MMAWFSKQFLTLPASNTKLSPATGATPPAQLEATEALPAAEAVQNLTSVNMPLAWAVFTIVLAMTSIPNALGCSWSSMKYADTMLVPLPRASWSFTRITLAEACCAIQALTAATSALLVAL